MSETLDLAMELIRRPSVTPEDAGCQGLLSDRLEALGFSIEPMPFDDVSNLWARRGTQAPLFTFAGHTDVVPPGPEDQWLNEPFSPTIRGGFLYGRGAADMKSSIAAMVVACERFLDKHHHHKGSIAFLLTSDEEGPSINGTVKVVEALAARREKIDWCLVGEPSSREHIGDVIKIGRRGSLNGRLIVHGVQGHVAYPHAADNAIHRLCPALAELCDMRWDEGNEHFPPTTFQVSNISSGTGADNVIPGIAEAKFNFRYSTASTADQLKQHVHDVLECHGLRYDLQWSSSGVPFITANGTLMEEVQSAIRDITQRDSEASTAGGTSDGRFIAPTGAQVIELGPVNATIHKINECVRAEDLETLTEIYERIVERLLL